MRTALHSALLLVLVGTTPQMRVAAGAPSRHAAALLAEATARAGSLSEPGSRSIARDARANTANAQPADRGLLSGLGRMSVWIDERDPERIWAVGDTFKASFGREGATYVPFFGSRAPRSHPILFRLAALRADGAEIALDAATMPVRDGDRIVFDRGAVLEVYDLSVDAVEQSFVLRAPLAGELQLDVAVGSDLLRASDAQGLVLESASGAVRYGRAFAVDGRAGRTDLDSGWSEEGIRIVVPAARVAAASWPLVVDPVITTFAVDDGVAVDGSPDAAFDVSTSRWLVVHERVVSATDVDVVYHLLSSDGTPIDSGFMDPTTIRWARPKVASNNAADRFVVVVEDGPVGQRRIATCGYHASGSLGINVTIASFLEDVHDPDIGGDTSALGPSYFCVVWERDYSPTDHDVNALLLQDNGAPFGSLLPVAITTGTLDGRPSISKTCGVNVPGAPRMWNVVWQRTDALGDADIAGRQIGPTGTLLGGAFFVDSSAVRTTDPAVSSPSTDPLRSYLVVATRQVIGSHDTDTHAWAMRGSTVVDSASLTALAGAPQSEQQRRPAVDCDGALFVVAEQESQPGSPGYDLRVSTFHLVGDQIALGEGHVLLAGGADSEQLPQVACTGSAGGPARRAMIVWEDRASVAASDVEAALYDASPFAPFCDPGSDGVAACPCGNAPAGPGRGCDNSSATGGASLVASGTVAPDTVVLSASGMPSSTVCLFVQGAGLVPGGAVFGDGVRCVAGGFVRLGVTAVSSGAAAWPGPGDPSITQRSAALGAPIQPGSDRYYFVHYRDAAPFACAATFGVTNAVRVRW
jgi:hypothetical protein